MDEWIAWARGETIKGEMDYTPHLVALLIVVGSWLWAYVEYLWKIFDLYVDPLTTLANENKLITPQKLKIIFPASLSTILATNETLLEKLRKRIKRPRHSTEIADVFLDMAPFLKCYTAFLNQFDESQQMYTQCIKDSKFKRFVNEKPSDARLDSLLIMPVQRIPRYVLLLKELLKHTEPTHRDFKDLKAAVEALESIGSHLNHSKKLMDNLNRVMEIERMLGIEHAHARRLIKEGELITDGKKHSCFLFNDAFIAARKRKVAFVTDWRFTIHLPIQQVMVFVNDSLTIQKSGTIGKNQISYSFQGTGLDQWEKEISSACDVAANSTLQLE
eukprot:TRINITY_DN7905_c0_g1_i2.p1 TRINITY_DN7905_c0_g1~~TRINITY_DN7905_c0_g1_i2.p1  ORF type:complete len:331 (+),score=78.20 TRINITY_DN7905_c0_g1_i2:133-1125(+)